MLWVRGLPLHEGHLFDLTLRDLLDLDLFLARMAAGEGYYGEVRHWWQIIAAADDIAELPRSARQHHPDAALLLAVRVWGSYRASGRSESFDDAIPDDLRWDEVLVDGDEDQGDAGEQLPRGFRAGNTQSSAAPDLDGYDINREVNSRLLAVGHLFGFTRDQVMSQSLYAWLGIAAAVDAKEAASHGR